MSAGPQTRPLLFCGGTVLAGDLAQRTSAVAVRDGVVIALGEDARDAAGHRADVIDLEGGALLPAFGDGHAHPLQGGLELRQAPVGEASSVEEVVEAVRQHAVAHPEASWVLGGGYDPALASGGVFDARWLDDAVPDRPVVLQSADHHCAWVNSEALRRAGLNAGSPDPRAGAMPRRPDGTPVGTLVEWTAMDLVLRHVPPPAQRERREALRVAAEHFAAAGITWVQEAAAAPEDISIYRAVADSDQLPIDVDVALRAEPGLWRDQLSTFVAARDEIAGHPQVTARTVKIFADGVVEAGTASLLDPYEDSGSRGLPVWSSAELAEAAVAFDAAAFQLHVHAIGDAAIRNALDAVEHVAAVNGPRDRRPVVTHVQVVHPLDLPRFAALGVVANVQPLWACLDACQRDLTMPRLGPTRSTWQYPFAALASGGTVLSTGSDWPVSSLRPLETLPVGVTRRTPEGDPPDGWLPEQMLSAMQVLRAATHGVAYQRFAERTAGRIARGASADLVWLDADVSRIPPVQWPHVTVRGAWSAGVRTFRP